MAVLNSKYVNLVNVFTVSPDHQYELVSILTRVGQMLKDTQAGLISTILHRSEDGQRVVNYTQWANDADFQEMLKNPHPEVRKTQASAARIATFEPQLYRLIRSIPDNASTVVAVRTGKATLIEIFKLEPERQKLLIQVVAETVEKAIAKQPGFLCACIHQSLDNTNVINYAQWDSPRSFDALLQTPEYLTYLKHYEGFSDADRRTYEVVEVIE